MGIKEAMPWSLYCAGKLHAVPGATMATISEFLTADHRHCDELFATAAQAAERDDWAGCRERFDAFHQALRHHMTIEEQVLFPAFEQATGISAGPTQVMRHEHQQMLVLLDRIAAAVAARDAPSFRRAVETFTALLNRHSTKEEIALYPMCDEALPDLSGEKLLDMVPQP